MPTSMSDDQRTLHRRALMALFAGAAAIAFAPIFVRLSEVGPIATAFHRMFLSLPIILVWVALDARRPDRVRTPATRGDWALLVLSGLMFVGDLSLWHWSINLTTIANATLFANFAPIFVTLGAFVLFGQRVTKLFVVGLVCAVAGVATLVGVSAGISEQYFLGDILGIATAFFYAGYILTVSRLREKFSTVTVMLWSGVTASVFLLPLGVLTDGTLLPLTLFGWLMILGLAIISHAGGQGLIAFALAQLPASFSSVGLLIQPVLAALIAWPLFAEPITGFRALGGAIVLLGIYLAHRGSRLVEPTQG